jgi:bifunctional oligoribonuclease and PAP phosphatase NrnA
MRALLEQAAERIAAADKILLTCHLGPDGDSVGSMVALAALLRARGKEATLYNPDLVPRRLKWMPLVKTFTRKLNPDTRYQLTVVVDCGDRKLLGDEFPQREVTGELIALDHHAAASPFGDLYVCDPEAACVGVLVARIARHLAWPIDAEAGVGMWVSLISDTGSFRYSNTNAEALQLAADVVAAGVDPWHVSERMSERASLGKYKLLSAALATLELDCKGKVAFMTISQQMVDANGAAWEDTEGMVNYTRSIKGVDCGVLITPAKQGGIRVSMRSKGRFIDAGAVAKTFGGGGHVGAAGCTLPGDDLTAARATIRDALAAALRSSKPPSG